MEKVTLDEYVEKENEVINMLKNYMVLPTETSGIFQKLGFLKKDCINYHEYLYKDNKLLGILTGAILVALVLLFDRPFGILDIIDVIVFFCIGYLFVPWIYKLVNNPEEKARRKVEEATKLHDYNLVQKQYNDAFNNQVEICKRYYFNSDIVKDIIPMIAKYLDDAASFLYRYKSNYDDVGFKLVVNSTNVELISYNKSGKNGLVDPRSTLNVYNFDDIIKPMFYNVNMKLSAPARMSLLYAITDKFNTPEKLSALFKQYNIPLESGDYLHLHCDEADNYTDSFCPGAYCSVHLMVRLISK